MNISYELWPIWCDYLEEQGFDTELLRYYLTYIYQSISSFYIPELTCGYGLYYGWSSTTQTHGHGYGYNNILSINTEYGNCPRAFINYYYGCGGRDIGYLRGDGKIK